ncbi:MAG: hypothetical protein QM778_31285 [Myxococcales bacterium]
MQFFPSRFTPPIDGADLVALDRGRGSSRCRAIGSEPLRRAIGHVDEDFALFTEVAILAALATYVDFVSVDPVGLLDDVDLLQGTVMVKAAVFAALCATMFAQPPAPKETASQSTWETRL